jgi:flagellar biosynthesis protein FlhB
MSDSGSDDSQKTEEPSQKRIDEARDKGDVPSSREVQNWFILAAGTLLIGLVLPTTASELARSFRVFIEAPHAIVFNQATLSDLFSKLISDVGFALVVPIGLLVVAAAASSLVQHGVLFTSEKMKPSLSKLSPAAGLKRMLSLRSVTELIKGLFKIAGVAIVAWIVIEPVLPFLEVIPTSGIGEGLTLLLDMTNRVMVGTVAGLSFLALFDYLYQRFEHTKKLRMTKQEVRDEYKQSEGDPQIKARLRSIRIERSRRRMMQAVPEADVVITNPTHFAVALKYDQATMDAPKVIAKGVDAVAFRIREKAESCDIAIVENPPLARALYSGVEIDETIKPEHFQAVAEIIAFVMGIGGNVNGRPRRPGVGAAGRQSRPLTR